MMSLAAPRWQKCQTSADLLTASYSAPPIPVVEIAESNGVDVVFADFGSHSEKVAGFCDFGAAKLYVNKADIKERQFFTVAHELGHWILHREFFMKNPEQYYYFPLHARYCDRAPLYSSPPHEDWELFSEEIRTQYPNCQFYVETRTQEEIKQSCENLRSRVQEYQITND